MLRMQADGLIQLPPRRILRMGGARRCPSRCHDEEPLLCRPVHELPSLTVAAGEHARDGTAVE